jgi:hypothetical protein
LLTPLNIRVKRSDPDGLLLVRKGELCESSLAMEAGDLSG